MTTRSVALVLALAASLAAGCAGLGIDDPDAFEPVTLNRVFPYPSEKELAGQKVEVLLAAQYTDDLPKARVQTTMKPLVASVDQYLSEAGAGVIDRSSEDLASARDAFLAGSGRKGAKAAGADFAIIARVDKLRHWSTYAPAKSLFKSEEELKDEPGICRHNGEVEARLKVFEIPTDDVARATITIHHSGILEETESDQSCPIADTRSLVFLEDILKEALPCLEAPLKNAFAPLGYIEEHRVKDNLHIYRTSMGSRNGATAGLGVAIFRVQYMTTRDDKQIRDERKIGDGVISDSLGNDHSWIIVHPSDLALPLLEGDLVRAVYDDPQSSMLGRGTCDQALSIQGEL